MKRICSVVIVLAWVSYAASSSAAESKPASQQEREKVLGAAKKAGQVAVYLSGCEEILPEFQKEYPETKLLPVIARDIITEGLKAADKNYLIMEN